MLVFFPLSGRAEELTLQAAVRKALERSPEMDSAARELRIAENERASAGARFLPSLDLSATHGIQDGAPSPVYAPWSSQLSLGLTEVLFDNGDSITRFKTAGLRREIAEVAWRRARARVCRDVGLEFFRYSLSIRTKEVAASQADSLKKQFALVSGEYRQGLKTRKDYLRFKTQVNRADLSLIAADNAIAKSRAELKRLLALSGEASAEGDAGFKPELLTFDLRSLSDSAPDLKAHYEYRIAELQRQANTLEADLIRRRRWPEVAVTSALSYGSANYLGTDRKFAENDLWSWNALLTLKFNVWDWGIRRRDAENAEERRAVQGNQLQGQLLQISAEVERLMLDLRLQRENYKLSEELLALEQDNLRLLEAEYRHGKVQYLDYITGLNDLSDAKVKYYSALSELWQGYWIYKYHEGTLYEFVFKSGESGESGKGPRPNP